MSESHPWFSAPRETLSPEGEVRRAQMRQTLSGAVRHRRQRRTALRAGGVGLAAAAGLVWWLLPPAPTPVDLPAVRGGNAVAVATQMVHADFERIADDPQHLVEVRRRMAATGSGLIERVDDAALPALLRSVGHSGGVIRLQGAVQPIGKVPIVDLGE